jgi:hypothetical protein
MLGAGRSGVQIPVWARYFFFKVQSGSRPHPASYSMGTGFFLGRKSGWGMTLTTDLHRRADVMNEWSSTSTPPWCLHSVDTDNFALNTRATYSIHLIPTDMIVILTNEEQHWSWSSSQYTFIHFPSPSPPPLFPNTPTGPWTHTFSFPAAHLTHPNEGTGTAELNLTKPMVPCT